MDGDVCTYSPNKLGVVPKLNIRATNGYLYNTVCNQIICCLFFLTQKIGELKMKNIYIKY